MNIRKYAINLLKRHGCDLNCYADTYYEKGMEMHGGYEKAMKDLSEAQAHGCTYKFPTEDLAKELVSIGNEQPIPPRKGHKRFCMIFGTEHDADGVEFDTFAAARANMEDTYVTWLTNEMREWKMDEDGSFVPTTAQLDHFEQMIENNYCYVVRWDVEKEEWQSSNDAFWMSSEDLKAMGFVTWKGRTK